MSDYALKDLTARREELVSQGVELDLAMGDAPSAEQRTSMRSIEGELRELDKEIDDVNAGEEARASIRSAKEAGAVRESDRTELYSNEEDEAVQARQEWMTPGETLVRSEAYTAFTTKFPGQMPMGDFRSDPIPMDSMRSLLGLQTSTEKLKARALVTSDNASAGELVYSMRRGLIEPGLVRPLTVADLVTTLPVMTDTIEYVREASRIENAGMAEEATALAGVSGVKNEGGLTFEVVTDTVKTIAEWVPATKRILQDANLLQAYVDEYLRYDLALELEDQIVSGSGVGEDFLGILVNPGTQAEGITVNENKFDRIRRAKTKVRLGARTNANAVLLNPNDAQDMDISKSGAVAAPYGYWGSGPFGPGNGPATLWGIPVVESEAVATGTAVVGDFSRAVLYDREATTISVGTANDDFIRNIVRILAEMRAGFGIIRPSAFVIVDLT